MMLVIDDYDSFTYNIVQSVGLYNNNIKVVRNDKFNIKDIENWQTSHIIISPGPGRPENAGKSIKVIKKYGSSIPILGVCLGHQAITIAYGGNVIYSKEIIHGKTSLIYPKKSALYYGIKKSFSATRYHSLISDLKTLPSELIITSTLRNGSVMSIQHKTHSVFGVQFHPESIGTKIGDKIIHNFLRVKK